MSSLQQKTCSRLPLLCCLSCLSRLQGSLSFCHYLRRPVWLEQVRSCCFSPPKVQMRPSLCRSDKDLHPWARSSAAHSPALNRPGCYGESRRFLLVLFLPSEHAGVICVLALWTCSQPSKRTRGFLPLPAQAGLTRAGSLLLASTC